jgi:hypothetical protein
MVANKKINVLEIARYKLNMQLRPNQIYDFRGAFIDHAVRSKKISDEHITLLANRTYKDGTWGKSEQQYPLVQYRISDGHIEIVSFGDGIQVIDRLVHLGMMTQFTIQHQSFPLHVHQTNRQSLIIHDVAEEVYMLFHYVPYGHKDDHLYHAQTSMVAKIGILQDSISHAIQYTLEGFGIVKDKVVVEIIDIITKDKASYKTRDHEDNAIKVQLTSYFLKIRCNVANLNQLSIGKHKSVGYGVIKKVI